MSRFQKLRRLSAAVLSVAVMAGNVGTVGSLPAVSAAAVPSAGPQDAKEVERFADAFFSKPEIKEQLAGASVAVVKGDRVLLNKGYGYADVEKQQPVDPDRTVFRVASVSKVITATAVMQLAEQGKIELNKELSAYLGDVRIPNETDTPLTMRHLLTNSTGFAYGDTSESATQDLTREAPLKQYVLENAPTVVRKPGAFYRYDNLGFTIQGYVVEQVSGQPFGTYIQEHIYKPLGMANSDFRLTPQLMQQLAVPYNQLGEAIPAYATVPTELPGGGMLSTSSDMAKFMMAHLGGGSLHGAEILRAETAAEMQRPQLAIHPSLPNMAYGFEYATQQNYNGRYVIEKAGDLEGYHTGMWLLPEEKVGLFVTVNKDFEIRTPLLEAFMDHYYPEEAAPPAPSASSASSPGALTELEGTYSDLRNRMWTTRIRVEDGKLRVQDPLGDHVLTELEPLLFQDEEGNKAAFKPDGAGSVQAFYYDRKSDSWAEKMAAPLPFPDVAADSPFGAYIDHLRQLKVLDDHDKQGEELFRPEQPITREEFVAWFIRWAGIAPSRQKPVFTDLGDSPYIEEIQAAYEFGLIQGSDEDKFNPQGTLTRQEAAALVWRMAFGYLHAEPKEAELSGVTDSWAEEGVRYVVAKQLYGSDVVQGPGGASDYRSRQPMLRQEAAALLSRFADHLF
ncbi:serine hydrolase [Paenibacillus puerhi]|uniref:serine hydrolase n=1 Tax=Paenibacillus puerhi TaxID=2692622 RepID=UPI001359341A|nr:serine hydrolase [Paenibacillus puerhi]